MPEETASDSLDRSPMAVSNPKFWFQFPQHNTLGQRLLVTVSVLVVDIGCPTSVVVLLRPWELVVVGSIRKILHEAVHVHYWPDSFFHLRVVLMVRVIFVPVEPLSIGRDLYPSAWCYRLASYPGRHHETIEVHVVVSNFLVFESLARLACMAAPEFLLVVDSNVRLSDDSHGDHPRRRQLHLLDIL